MNIVPDWQPNPEFPDELRAPVEIAGEECLLKFVDHVAPSGIRYKSIAVHAPYQGRGMQLHVEINGVPLTLDWNGGNDPPFPATPISANYRRERLSDDQVERLRHGKPPNEGTQP